MLKDKKSVIISFEALVRLIITIGIILLIILPVYYRLRAAFFDSDRKYLQSFQDFVDNINKMPLGRATFELRLKEKSAITGFSKNAERYECVDCIFFVNNIPEIIFDKPKNEECIGNACICLCSDGFELKHGKDSESRDIKTAICSRLICKKIEHSDIIDMVKIDYDLGRYEYWKNGFLFVNGVASANGLKLYNEEISTFTVEKTPKFIGVCNYDMLKFNKEKLKSDNCIVVQQDENK